MGYFHGNWRIEHSGTIEFADPIELFSMVPSRPFFPRGFLWDEGFHLLVLLDWDIDMALEVISSWFALIDEDGWIAREQILGPEARSKVPSEFQVQSPNIANPPTLFLVLAAFVDRLSGDMPYSGAPSQYLQSPETAKQLLSRLYPLLRRHYDWFRRTQAGDLTSPDYHRPFSKHMEGYRWRGGTSRHILSSGLDDYPRAQPPSSGELHLDAMSWVGSMAGAMRKISHFLGENDKTFLDHESAVKENIDILHWSENKKVYCDATIEDGNHVHVCHPGYISLFPFLLGLLDRDHVHLDSILDFIHDEAEIWSPYGLRSLSRASPLYSSEENYWRSPIWININFLAIERLLVSFYICQISRLGLFRLTRDTIGPCFTFWSIPGKITDYLHGATSQHHIDSLQFMAHHRICMGAV
jgi:mannosyl-oligosaccharide glucosidase